jgi:NADH dehydrogenase
MASEERRRPRVVIVGGGFGGLHAAQQLRRFAGEVVVVDRTNHHLFQPLLYQVATAALSPGDIAVPIRQILRRQRNATVLMGEVVEVDRAARVVRLADGVTLAYDFLVLAVGARHSYFGNPEWERHAPGLKTLADALYLRDRCLASFEWAERLGGGEAARPYLTFVVVGAGPTGVEVAGALAEIARQTMVRNFRRIDPRTTRVLLVEAGPRVLPTFSPALGEKARRSLEELGVEVWLGRRVGAVEPWGAVIDGERVESANVLWAAGNQAAPLLASLGVERDRQGRALVRPDCSLPGSPEVFVIGDAAHLAGEDGQPLPGVAQVAMQQGRHVARLIAAGQPADARPPFRYIDLGVMATIGKARAVAKLGAGKGVELAGWLAWLAWSFLHVAQLVSFRNRVVVMAEWIFWYFTGRRGIRLISRPLEALGPPPPA